MARRTKYDADTFPLLAEGYARSGLTDEQIAKNLGITNSTFYIYQSKYPEFAKALCNGKAPVDFEVENALLKRALGFDYVETHVTTYETKDGETVKEKKSITKTVVPDTGAIAFWLKNRMPLKWRDKQDLNINYEDLPDDQLNAIVDKLLNKAENNRLNPGESKSS